MKRFATIALSFFALVVCATGAGKAAATGSWGPWESTYQGPITAPAGVVCPFEVTAEPVMENLRIRYHYDGAGNIDGYEVTGPLVARVTNTENGKSVRRNLASKGTVFFNPDGSYDAVVDGNFLLFFLDGDNPAHELLLLTGRTVLHGSPTGEKTLVSAKGRSENLCETLA